MLKQKIYNQIYYAIQKNSGIKNIDLNLGVNIDPNHRYHLPKTLIVLGHTWKISGSYNQVVWAEKSDTSIL